MSMLLGRRWGSVAALFFVLTFSTAQSMDTGHFRYLQAREHCAGCCGWCVGGLTGFAAWLATAALIESRCADPDDLDVGALGLCVGVPMGVGVGFAIRRLIDPRLHDEVLGAVRSCIQEVEAQERAGFPGSNVWQQAARLSECRRILVDYAQSRFEVQVPGLVNNVAPVQDNDMINACQECERLQCRLRRLQRLDVMS